MIEKQRITPTASPDYPDSNEDIGSLRRRPRQLQPKMHQTNRRKTYPTLRPVLLLLMLPWLAIALPSLVPSGRGERVPSPTSVTNTESAAVFETEDDVALLSSEPLSLVEGYGSCCFLHEPEGTLEMRDERGCKKMAETEAAMKKQQGCFHQDVCGDFCFEEVGTLEIIPRQLPRNNTTTITPTITPYIVRWLDYYPMEKHEQLLSRASGGLSCGASPDNVVSTENADVLEGVAGWCFQLIERRNAATTGKFPSDFAVVRLVQQGQWFGSNVMTMAEGEGVLEALRGSDLVKGVYEDVVLNRGTANAEYLHYNGGDEHQISPDDVTAFDTATNGVNKKSVGVTEAGEISQSESSGEIFPPCGANTKTRRLNRELEPEFEAESGGLLRRLYGGASKGGLRGSSRDKVDASRQARPLHEQGFLGAGIRVAVFDTGLEAGGHDFSNVVERINWTNEDELSDVIGHGTHVTGVIGGRDNGCPGMAPDSTLHAFRLFSSQQVSYTSWFLDAFNYALFLEVDVINLSIGGPDFMDRPFVDKIRELSAHGVVIVSAVGNDGPAFGTQHNPADQADVIGVGALSASGKVASFQSRGMTTWELPGGYGRVKPDVLASGQHVLGPKAGEVSGKCGVLSGTSVASPVVAGAVAVLASSMPQEKRRQLLNPASIKQVLVESARKVKQGGVFEQGAGALNLEGAFRLLEAYTPRASLLPPSLDLTDPYMWPFSRQPLYYGAMPVMFNLTVLNGMGVTGRITTITWEEEVGLVDGIPRRENVLNVRAEYPDVLWPWSGHLAISLSVSESGRHFTGLIIGRLQVTVVSEEGILEAYPQSTDIFLPITVSVIQTPPRNQRLLWDQFHSMPYPPTYSPRDYLGDDSDMLDRLGDHPHTNFRSLFDALLDAGYYLDVLGSDWTSFEAKNYGALLVVDPEAETSEQERAKLEQDVREKGLSLVVFADWYSTSVMEQVRFVDDNTRMPWRPVTGGSNLPALNDLLLPSFGMALGGTTVLDGVFTLPGGQVHLASGNAVARMPPGGVIISADSLRAAVVAGADGPSPDDVFRNVPVIGALDTNRLSAGHALFTTDVEGAGGRVFLFGDSSCADDAAQGWLEETEETGRLADCLWLFKSAVRYACEGYEDPAVFRDAMELKGTLSGDGFSDGMPLPKRYPENKLLEAVDSRSRRANTHESTRESLGVRRWRDVPNALTQDLRYQKIYSDDDADEPLYASP